MLNLSLNDYKADIREYLLVEAPDEIGNSPSQLISLSAIYNDCKADFWDALPVEAPDEIAAGQTEYLQYKSLLSDESRRVSIFHICAVQILTSE